MKHHIKKKDSKAELKVQGGGMRVCGGGGHFWNSPLEKSLSQQPWKSFWEGLAWQYLIYLSEIWCTFFLTLFLVLKSRWYYFFPIPYHSILFTWLGLRPLILIFAYTSEMPAFCFGNHIVMASFTRGHWKLLFVNLECFPVQWFSEWSNLHFLK